MALNADVVAPSSAPPFPFALEAELRPLEGFIARLRRSDRPTETRHAIRAAARRIEMLSRSANRTDVAELATALDAYFGDGEALQSVDSFDDAKVVCATVDLLSSKLPGAFEGSSVFDLKAFVTRKFQTRCETAILKSQEQEPSPPAWLDAAAPWSAVDDAIDRSYESHLSDAEITLEQSEPEIAEPQASDDERTSSAELDRMIAEAFPGIDQPREQVVEPSLPGFDWPESVAAEDAPVATEEQQSFLLAEITFEAASEPPMSVEEPIAEVVAESPAKSRRGRKSKAEPKPPKEKAPKRPTRNRKKEIAKETIAAAQQVSAAIDIQPANHTSPAAGEVAVAAGGGSGKKSAH
jgi:chemotaxis protein histidine kinase CheA